MGGKPKEDVVPAAIDGPGCNVSRMLPAMFSQATALAAAEKQSVSGAATRRLILFRSLWVPMVTILEV